MQIIYIASVFDNDCINKRFNGKSVLPYAASKYNTLLFEGLATNNISTNVLSVVPINRNYYKKIFFNGYTIKKKKLNIRYISQINIPAIKNVFNMISGFFKTLFAKKGTLVVYDVLVVSASIGALFAAKLRNFKKVGIVTDLPKFQPIAANSYMLKQNDKIVKSADGYIFLTKQMNEEVNADGKPYLVLEGHVDANMKALEHCEFFENEKNIIYAGAIEKIYGIEMLCKAFLNIAHPGEYLHIYGNGDYAEDLTALASANKNIFYHGNRPNNEIVEAELSATLLVNPRPTDGEYTKFSFPSKTLEYMVSGTPVLSSRLAGIPEEYENYIYYFDENTAESLGRKMREILDLSPQDLKNIGKKARAFALEEKNNIVQAAKIVDFCYSLQNKENKKCM